MFAYLIYRLVFSFLRLLEVLIVVRAVCSWFPQVQSSRVYDFIYTFTEPVIQPIRNVLNRLGFGGQIDFSSVIALLIIYAIEELLNSLIF